MNILRVTHQPKQMQWEPHDVLSEGLNLQAEMGDVQTSVCILTVLGERRNDLPIEKIVQVNEIEISPNQDSPSAKSILLFQGILATVLHRTVASSSIVERGYGDNQFLMATLRLRIESAVNDHAH